MEATGRRIEPGRVIGEAFETYQSQMGPLLGGALIVIGIAAVINGSWRFQAASPSCSLER
ncbi:MAG: hypothetical protein WB771_00405 [Solirubrobacterales bacterium]